jgi:sugar/nucleoside kinase (ribokinase family)
VIYVGVVGNDFAGQLFADELVQSGVTPQLIAGAGPTGVVVSLVAPDGQRAMMTDRGVNDQLTVDHVATVLEEPLDHLHLSGYTLLDDVTRPIGTAALDMARSKGATTSVDVCSVGPLAQVGVPVFLEAAMPISMLFANGEERAPSRPRPEPSITKRHTAWTCSTPRARVTPRVVPTSPTDCTEHQLTIRWWRPWTRPRSSYADWVRAASRVCTVGRRRRAGGPGQPGPRRPRW